MRKLLWLLVILIIIWCVYWAVTARLITAGTETWMDQRRDEGWAADAMDVGTSGFPIRFDTHLSDVRLADPDTSVGVVLPALSFSVPATRPNRVQVTFPKEFTLLGLGEQAQVTNEGFTTHLHLKARTTLDLGSAGFEFSNLSATGPDGWDFSVDRGNGIIQETEGSATYDISFAGHGFKPGRFLKSVIDPDNILPDAFETASLSTRVTFDRPWNRQALEDARPQPTKIVINLAEGRWGQLDLKLAGAFDVGPGGVPEGKITVKATNWRDMLALGVANGSIPENMTQILEGILDGLSKASGPPNTLDVPITLSDGLMRIGFLPLGPAPRFYLR